MLLAMLISERNARSQRPAMPMINVIMSAKIDIPVTPPGRFRTIMPSLICVPHGLPVGGRDDPMCDEAGRLSLDRLPTFAAVGVADGTLVFAGLPQAAQKRTPDSTAVPQNLQYDIEPPQIKMPWRPSTGS